MQEAVVRRGSLAELGGWPLRRWAIAAVATVGVAVLVGLPTDLIPNPIFGRAIPPTVWSYPVLAVTSVLSGLLIATYVRVPQQAAAQAAAEGAGAAAGHGVPHAEELDGASKRGMAGGVITFFAVGCPVCNKLVLLALGTTGAVRYFEPVQPLLAVASILLLAYALRERLRSAASCPLPSQASALLP